MYALDYRNRVCMDRMTMDENDIIIREKNDPSWLR